MVLRHYKLSNFAFTKRLLSVNNVFDKLLFAEKLYVYNNDGKRIGRFSIKVDLADISSCKMLIVHISNKGFLDKSFSESILTGVVTMNLKTVEEIRHELSEIEEGNHERIFYLLRERKKYYYSVTETVCELENNRHGTIPFLKTNGLIGEAANILLMRALVVSGYHGILSVRAILSNGKLVRNYYITKSSRRIVNGKKMDIVVVYRSVTDHEEYNVTSTCSFTKAGQLIDVFWSNSEYFIHIDPDMEVWERMPNNNPVSLTRHWNRDKQIFSYFLDKVFEIESHMVSFRVRNQETRRVVGDWIELVLLTKPSNILCSAIEFFSSFGKTPVRNCSSPDKQPNQVC